MVSEALEPELVGGMLMNSHGRIARRVLAEHVAIAGRLRADPRTVLDYALSNLARWSTDFEPASKPRWIIDWEHLLSGPRKALIAVLTADTEAADRLRAASPFMGLLTFRERHDILRRVDPEMARTLELFGIIDDQGAHTSRMRPKR